VDDASDERLRLKQAQEGEPAEDGGAAEEDVRAVVLETWVQFVPTGGVEKALRDLRTATKEGSEPTFVGCMTLHEQMVKALRHLSEIVPGGNAHDLFQDLANMEDQAMRDLGLADTMREDG
jgi:hypothetical protein